MHYAAPEAYRARMPFQISSAVSANQNNSPVFLVDNAFMSKKIEIDCATPIVFAHEDLLDFSRLDEGEHLEQLVECAVSSRKGDQRFCAQEKMELAHREVMKAETEIGRDVRVGILFVRQADVEADRLCSNIECAAIAPPP